MSKKNDIEVIINGKRYMLSGYESEEYLQRVAGFINSKIVDLKHQEFYKLMDSDMRNIVVQLNLADEYFKMKKLMEELESDSNSKGSEIYSLKHDLIDLQTKLDVQRAEMKALRDSYLEEQKKNIRLETELAEGRKKMGRIRPERSERVENPERTEKPENPPKTERVENPNKMGKSERTEKIEIPERLARLDKTNRTEEFNISEILETAERTDKE